MKKPENQLLVIFGASGDLTMRKLMPALYDLASQDLLPEKFAVLGVGRTPLTDSEFRNKMIEALKKFETSGSKNPDLPDFINSLYYQAIETSVLSDYSKIKTKIKPVGKNFCLLR